MLNRSTILAMSASVLEALPCKLIIKRHSPSILFIFGHCKKGLRVDNRFGLRTILNGM